MKKDFKEILVSTEEINEICQRLGKQISADYEGKNLLLVSVLKGGVVFMADLMRNITCDCKIDFLSVSSYNGVKTSGHVSFKKDLDLNPEGCDILIVEDILDSGITLSYLKKVLADRKANSIKIDTEKLQPPMIIPKVRKGHIRNRHFMSNSSHMKIVYPRFSRYCRHSVFVLYTLIGDKSIQNY
jgi:hypoxanthine phosphoribosyltransferase